MERNSCILSGVALCAVAAVLTATFTEADAQTTHKLKLQARNTQESAKSAKADPAPTGPIGLGALKIGMTFNAVSALTEADGIYPVQPLQVDTRNTARGNGGMSYRARMRTPLDTDDSTPVSFSFVDGKLIGFSVELDDSHFARAMTQIVDKYGKGELADDRKDEQCLYRNGANFKVNWGALSHRWTQRISDNTVIQTSATEFTVAMCPPSLDGPALEPSTSHHISFDEIVSAPKPTSNPF